MTDYSTDTARTRFVFGHPEWEIEIQGADHIGADFDRFIRKVKADFLKEIIREVRDIPCWYPDSDPMGGEFDLDGESHRRFVLDTLLAYGSKLF